MLDSIKNFYFADAGIGEGADRYLSNAWSGDGA